MTNVSQCKEIIPYDVHKKRIDHRHHALDALIVALATSNHVNYINNQSGLDINSDRIGERKDLKAKYMITKNREDGTKKRFFLPPMQYKEGSKVISYNYAYKDSEPQTVFKDVVVYALQNTLVTFKQNNRIMRQRTNYINHPDYEKGLKEKELNLKKNYSVRQSLHKQTFYGKRFFRPMCIEKAIDNPEIIVENRVKYLIKKSYQEGLNKKQIIQKLKDTDAVVYIKEACAVTQWSHSIDYLKDVGTKIDEKSGKSAIIKEIECIADICIQNILKRHLANYDSVKLTVPEASLYYVDIVNEEHKELVDVFLNSGKESEQLVDVFVHGRDFGDKIVEQNPQIAFSTDGIEDMNNHIAELNKGKSHKPIYKVKVCQTLGKMFPVSERKLNEPIVAKNKQYVSTDEGSNNICGVYKSKNGDTKIYVPSLREVIEATRNGEELFPEFYPADINYKFRFSLSPFDLVYMPTKDEIENGNFGSSIEYSRIYVMNDVNDQNQMYFRPFNYAAEIIENEIDLQKDKKGKIIGSRIFKTANCDNMSIRDNCVPVEVDRLGNIIKIIK